MKRAPWRGPGEAEGREKSIAGIATHVVARDSRVGQESAGWTKDNEATPGGLLTSELS